MTRKFLFVVLLLAGCIAHAQISGLPTPGMAIYDAAFPALMQKWSIPGGAVAVVKDGRLVFTHGYGIADSNAATNVQPYSRFRIASLTKATTSLGILVLVEKGLLRLDDKVFTILNNFTPYNPSTVDPRIYNITVRDLLHHTGGWDRNISPDPMFRSSAIAAATGTPIPASDTAIIRYMMSQTLDHAPGTMYAYSNFGYCLLGRIIEKITGVPYTTYMKGVFAKAGISRITQGETLTAQADEVHYYDFPGSSLATNVFTGAPNSVPWPYGGFYFKPHDANGGWISSVIDYLRFMDANDGRTPPDDILSAAMIDTMVARPAPPVNSSTDVVWYGMGWLVRQAGSVQNWWHDGGLPGTTTYAVRAGQTGPYAWVAFFNSRPVNVNGFENSLDSLLWSTAGNVTSWPTYDLFIPLPQAPAKNAVNVSISPTLRWYYADRTDGFHLQVATTGDFMHNVIDDSGMMDTQKLITNLQQNTTYFWRVASNDGTGDHWSPIMQFTTGATEVGEPEIARMLTVRNFPDPVRSSVTFEYSIPDNVEGRITILNMLGQRVLATVIQRGSQSHGSIIDCGALESGVYTYLVESGKNIARGTMRVVK